MRRCGLVVLVAVVLLGEAAGVAVPAAQAARGRRGTTVERARLRDAPEREGAPLVKLPAAAEVAVDGRPEDGFYPVTYGGIAGWLPTGAVAVHVDDRDGRGGRRDAGEAEGGRLDAAQESGDQGGAGGDRDRKRGRERDRGRRRAGREAIVAADALNLRAEPDPAAAVLLTVPEGEAVAPVGADEGGYVRVAFGEAEGWVLGAYLEAPAPERGRRGGRARSRQSEYGRREIKEIVYAAADRYGQSRADMLRVARCESDLVPTAVNKKGGSYGLFQFKPATWRSTPYADYDIFDPRPNALAAGWMWSVGRKREWVCQ